MNKTGTIAIVPARAGSKGIKNKNLKKLNGAPLIDHTLKFASSLNIFDEVLLTSDSKKILSRAREYNCLEINRPKELAKDDSLMIDVVIHAYQEFANRNKYEPQSIVLLQPTYPYRKKNDLKIALKKHIKQNRNPIVAVQRMQEHPCECFYKGKNDSINYLIPPPQNNNRQNYPEDFFFITGNFYISSINKLKSEKSFINSKTEFFETSEKLIIDIDTPKDFEFAEKVYSWMKECDLTNL